MWPLRPLLVAAALGCPWALRLEQPEGPGGQDGALRVAGACERNGTWAPCRCEAPEPLLPFRMAQWVEARAASPKATVDSVLPWKEVPRPRVVMVMAGTNNIGDEAKELAHLGEIVQCRGVDDAVCGVRALLDLAQRAWPGATLVLHAVLPRTREEVVPERVAPLNHRLKGLVEELNDAVWLDCSRVFLDGTGAPDNTLYNDNVHPSPEGYSRWMECLIPQLEALE
ncbi:unnamed protein product [Prorocentrum cordatum]|uniref:SGNH hydrolase-type esterase domain-containing protein n=1 Tax=Prorocentrum cordatum TaxID=2364126 RepID=A0ABN9XLE8_9DINO|nr:unnamed protein product [Polarella glacialis]